MRTLTIGIQKGGVGKTTTSVHVATHLARLGIDTLLVDLDSQGQAGSFLGLPRDPAIRSGIVTLLKLHNPHHPFLDFTPASDTIHRGLREHLDIIASDARLAPTETEVRTEPAAGMILRRRLDELGDAYQACIIDVGPGVTFASELAYVAADVILTPIEPGEAAADGLRELQRRLAHLQAGYRLPARPHLVFANKVDYRERLTRDLDTHLASLDLPRGPDVRKAASLGQAVNRHMSIFEFEPNGRAASDYARLSDWVAPYVLKGEPAWASTRT